MKFSPEWHGRISAFFDSEKASIIVHSVWNVVRGDATHHIVAWRKWRIGKEQKQHRPYQKLAGCGPVRPFFSAGGGTSLPSLCTSYIWNGHIFPPLFFPNNICSEKARQVVRVDWSWMDFLSLSLLSFYIALSLSLPFSSILQSPEASISLITESLHLNGRLCIVRTKGRVASEEVLDRGMDWAQRLGWVELQVQASSTRAESAQGGTPLPTAVGPSVTG